MPAPSADRSGGDKDRPTRTQKIPTPATARSGSMSSPKRPTISIKTASAGTLPTDAARTSDGNGKSGTRMTPAAGPSSRGTKPPTTGTISLGKSSGGGDTAGSKREDRIRMTGLPLSVQFMLVISVLVGGVIVCFFAIVFLIATKAVDDEIAGNGANLARALANIGKIYSETTNSTEFLDAQLRKGTVRNELKSFFATWKNNIAASVNPPPNWSRFTPLNNPVMNSGRDGRFRLADQLPDYASLREFQEDIVRAYAQVQRYLDGPDQKGLRFQWAPGSNRSLVDAFLAFCDVEPDKDFLDPAERKAWMDSKRDTKKKVIEAPDRLKEELQRIYKTDFNQRYIRPMVANQNLEGLGFVELFTGPNGAPQFKPEFQEPKNFPFQTGGDPVEGGDVLRRRTAGADGVDVLQFSTTKKADIERPDGTSFEKEFVAVVHFNFDKVQASKSKLMLFLTAIALLAIVIGICVSYFLANQITRPINSLVEDVLIIAKGEYSHKTRLKPNNEIGVLARTVDRMTEGLEIGKKATINLNKMTHDVSIVEDVMIHLLPDSLPKIYGYDTYAFYNPSKEVGGDYYDFYQIDPNHVGMIVADVSGKGLPGAMVMVMARAVLRYESANSFSPRETFMRANRHIVRDIKRGMFVTAFYLVLNNQTAEMQCASAGHNPLLLWRAQTGKVEKINPNGIALGFDKGPIFERTIKEEKVQLYSGDRVVLYTDGVVEAMSPDGEEFTEERFIELIESYPDANSNQLTNIIVQQVQEHQSTATGGEQHDDITIVTFKLL